MAKKDKEAELASAAPVPALVVEEAPDPFDRANYKKAIYVTCDGDKLDARVIPAPTRKGAVVQIPKMMPDDVAREQSRIAQLPMEKRLGASSRLVEAMSSARPALNINGNYVPLVLHDGELFSETEFQGVKVACADLLINVNTGKIGYREDWRMACKTIHADFMAKPTDEQRRAGARGKPYFSFVK